MSAVLAGYNYKSVKTERCDTPVFGKRFVKMTTGSSGTGVSLCGAGQIPLGVALWDAGDSTTTPPQRTAVSVGRGGTPGVCYAGAAIAIGDRLMVDANGYAITYVPGSGVYSFGQARTAASSQGDEINYYDEGLSQ
jgi:hypothetical protein